MLSNMLLQKKIITALLICLLIGVILVAILVPVLTQRDDTGNDDDDNNTDEYVCEDERTYRRVTLKSGLRSHLEKVKLGLPPVEVPTARNIEPEWGWIEQRLDHFDGSNLKTWSMRYLSSNAFYQEGGPMFVFLGGEWAISRGYLLSGQMYDMAQATNGYMFYTEHRYYGASFPTEDLCTYNLLYNSADQALADIAYFIEQKKSEIPGMQDSKVVVVGGSYSAMLATWMRIKYPHLVDAALSSSAPLRAKADFYEYYEVVSDNLKLASEECVTTINEAIVEAQQYLEEGRASYVSEKFRTCNEIDVTEPHLSYFFLTLASPFASIVQYASDNELKETCDQLLSYSGSSLEKLASFFEEYYGSGVCLSDYNYYIYYLSYPVNSPLLIYRQWFYQTCTEYGFYQTSASSNQPFRGFELDLFIDVCRDVFNVTEEVLNTGIERTNLFYGADNPAVTKVVSVHGTVDPWHKLGALEDINSEAPVFVVEGTSHCADLLNSDVEAMKEVKDKVTEIIINWIS